MTGRDIIRPFRGINQRVSTASQRIDGFTGHAPGLGLKMARRAMRGGKIKLGLPPKMPGDIRLKHRRHRMAAHHRMPVEAKNFTAHPRKQMTKTLVTAHLRGGDENRHAVDIHHLRADFNGFADGADVRR